MNGAVMQAVPAVAKILVEADAVNVDVRHQKAILVGRDLMEGLQEEMTLESVSYLSSLIDLLRADLAYCRSGLLQQEGPPAV